MKENYKISIIAAAACIMLVLGGCATPATENSGTTTNKTDDYSAVESATVTTRTVTFPAIYFEDMEADQIASTLEERGCTDIVANEDGSYTTTMSIEKYNELVDAMHAAIVEQFDAVPNSSDYPSITAIEYDDQFSAISLNASATSLGLSEMFVNWVVAFPACMYQQIAGQPVSCSVTVVGPDGATIQSGHYPDDWDDGSSSTTSEL